VEELEAGYDTFLASWRQEILDGLTSGDDADTEPSRFISTAGDGP
jgi:hypothetical protein